MTFYAIMEEGDKTQYCAKREEAGWAADLSVEQAICDTISNSQSGSLATLKAVLVAISIPVFTGSLIKSKEATDMANLRAAYAQAVTDQLTSNTAYPATYDAGTFGALNFASKATWKNSSGLTVTYTGTKAGSLSLHSDALE